MRVSCFDNVKEREREVGLSLTEDGLVTENLHTHILFGPSSSRTCMYTALCVCVCVSNVTRWAIEAEGGGFNRFLIAVWVSLSRSPIHRYLVAPSLLAVLRQKVECNIAHKCRHLAPFFRLFGDGTKHFDILAYTCLYL